MKLEQLYYLAEVAKYKSISIAAEKNYISQPSMSGSIIKLEKELGKELLHRTSRGVILTELGEDVLEKSKMIIDCVKDIEDLAKEHDQKGRVRIASIPCFCDRIIPQAILRMKEQQLDVLLSIKTGESADVAGEVASGNATLGFVIHYDDLQDKPGLTYHALFQDEYVLYIGPFSPYWDATSITLEEALKQPYIAYRDEFRKNNGGLTDLFYNRRPNIVFRTDDNESLKRMIAQDNYVAFFPRFMSRDDFYFTSGLLRGIPVSDADLIFEVGYIASTKYKIDRVGHIFLDVLNKTIDCDSELWPCIQSEKTTIEA